MSRVFKRPMFRKGGGANMNGIMSNVQDRENYEKGTELTPRQRYEQIVNQYSGPSTDPLGRYLIEGSLRGLSTAGGTTLQNLSKAFGGEPLQRFFDTQDRQRMSERDMKLAGLEMDIDEENRLRKLKEAKEATKDQQKFELDLLAKKQAFQASEAEKVRNENQLNRDLKLQIAQLPGKSGSSLQKDYSPERIYFETLQKYTDPKAAGYITTIQQEYPEAFAEFAAYIGPSIRQNDNLKGGFIGVLPNKKKGKTRQYNFDEMIPGGVYFKPDTKRLYERDAEKNILIEYDPYSGKKLREIPLE